MGAAMLCDSALWVLKHQRIASRAIICHSMAILLGSSWVAVMTVLKSKQTEPPRGHIQAARSGQRFPFHLVVEVTEAVWDVMQAVLNRSFHPLFLVSGEMAPLMDVLVVIPMLTALTTNQSA